MSEMAQCAEEHAKQAEKMLSFAPFALAACGLYASSLYSYLLFHTLVEIFCVFVMLAVFLLSWNSRRQEALFISDWHKDGQCRVVSSLHD